MLNTQSDTINRPRRTGGLTASWTQENAAITSSDAVLDDVSLSLRKLAILVKSSNEIYQDSASDLAQWLTDEASLAFFAIIDDTGFNGDGSATFSGMTGLAHTLTGASLVDAESAHDTFAEISALDLGNTIAAVRGAAIQGAKWYCSPQAFGSVFCRLSVTTGGMAVNARASLYLWAFPS